MKRRNFAMFVAASAVVFFAWLWWWTTRRERLVGDAPPTKKWAWKSNGGATAVWTNRLAFDKLKPRSELSPKVHPASCRDPGGRWFAPNPSKYDFNVLQFLVDQGARMMHHLTNHPKYKNYEYTRNLRKFWNGSVFSSLQRTGGAQHADTKCIGIQLDYDPDDVPFEMSGPRLNTRLLHEMAHAASFGFGHQPYFAQANRWLVNVATKELGWRVALKCAACRRSGVCRNDCPGCEWWDDPKTCLPYEPGP